MKTTHLTWLRLTPYALIIALLIGLNACRNITEVNKYNVTFIALSDFNSLMTINSDQPSQTLKNVFITGLASGDKILGIDYRPATGQLYGVGSSSRLYVINPESGVARQIGTTAFTPALNGSIVGFDFNPTVDRIRLTTNSGQNLRLNPETGAVAATDGNLNPGTPSVSEVAYTNNRAGAATTTLYTIDVNSDKLLIQNPPNNGTLVEVGNLGVNAQAAAGFDITTFDIGFAALRVNGRSGLYFINLVSGKASLLGNFPTGINIIGLAISTEPVAYAVDGTNNLLIFNPFNIQPVSKAITGLQSGENILGIDMRPANGQLYALGSTSRLYTINASSGVAAVVGTAPLAPVLNGTQFGFDFNPTVDRIRIVSNTGQNLRAHPETGAIAAVDGALNPGTPAVTAAAYTNNFAGATTTSLFVIDATNKKLYLQNPPNNGTLTSVGDLPNTFSQSNGFDIGGTTGKAYGLFQDDNLTRLYEINLQTGQLNRGIVVPATSVRGFAIGLGF